MKKPDNLIRKFTGLIIITLSVIMISLSGCKKEEGDGVLSGDIIYSYGFVNSNDFFTYSEAYIYVFLDDDDDVTNGYTARLTIDIVDLTPGTTTVSYEINTAEIPSGKYYLMAAYDFSVQGSPSNTNPETPGVWEAKGWIGSTTTRAPDAANVSDLSADYDITLHGLE